MTKINKLFEKELKIINIGLELFYRDLKKQKYSVIHVDWRPIAGGDKKMASLLSKLQ
ncbi:MAG: fdrA domain protein [Tissierellia bacterium]|nr:fdrA domain protein [Tissierellia bacterium]